MKHKNAEAMIKITENQEFLKDQEGNQKFTMLNKGLAKEEEDLCKESIRESAEREGRDEAAAGIWADCPTGG